MKVKRRRVFVLAISTLLTLLLIGTQVALPNRDNTATEAALDRFPLANKHFLKGKQAFQDGNFKKAGKEFEQCLELFPFHAQAHLLSAQLQYQKANYQKAEYHIVSAKSNYEKLSELLKKTQMDETNRRKAESSMLRSALHQMEASYDQYECKKGISRLMSSAQDELTSIDSVELTTGPGQRPIPAGYFYIHGNILYKQNKISAAIEQYKQVLAADPYHAGALNNVCSLYYYAGEYALAWAAIMDARSGGISVDPKLEEYIRRKCGNAIQRDSFGVELPGNIRVFSRNVGSPEHPNFENVYVVVNELKNEALIVDPGSIDPGIEAFIEAKNLKVRMILNTHGHRDHSGANHYYASRYGVSIAGHIGDSPLYREGDRKNEPDIYFSQNKDLEIPGWTLRWFHTPGHTSGSVSYLINGSLFSGDTLFKNGIGAISASSKEEEIKKTNQEILMIQRHLLTMQDSLRVLPGHGPGTTIGEEKRNNPFLVTANHSSQ